MAMLNEVMVLMCMLLELVAQVIEGAGVERNLLEESAEADTNKAERDLGSGSGSLMGGRPLTWLVLAVNGPGSGPPVGLRWNPIGTSQCSLLRSQGTKTKAVLGGAYEEGLLNGSQETACAAQRIHSSFYSQSTGILEERTSYPHETSKQGQIRHPLPKEICPPSPPRRRHTTP